MTELAPTDDDVARIRYVQGRSESGSRGGDENVVQLDVPRAVDPEPRILRHGRDGEMPDGDVIRVVQQQALDAYSAFPLDSQRPGRACCDDQFAPVHMPTKPDRAAAIPQRGDRSRELSFVPNLDTRELRLGTRRKNQHEQCECCEQTA